jgi:hypothetical protein
LDIRDNKFFPDGAGMKQIKLILIVFAIAFSSNSNALTTMGSRSCGVWVKEHNTNIETVLTAADGAWLTGYLTGFAIGTNIDILKGAEGESLILWITNYCNSNPLDNVGNAATSLALELKRRMHQ